ncbi:MAG: hypothetical protein PHC75_04315 [Burkholderiales bacterium]|nr:hypothetical protein [Burkholderiales bacterium]
MNKLNIDNINSSFFDISQFETKYSNGVISLNDEDFFNNMYQSVVEKNGYAVCYNTCKILKKHGLNIKDHADAEIGRQFLENLFRKMASKIDLALYSPDDANYEQIIKMDVDGFNINKAHTPNQEHTVSREFVTTKCIHFDAATPFIANVYGPNENIKEGFPIICDTKKYCLDNNINPINLVENIQEHYNVVVKPQYYNDILNDYSFGLDIDLTNDLIMIALYNEIIGGVAHAATQPLKQTPSENARRPIRHIEYTFKNMEDLNKWYKKYNLILEQAGNSDLQSPASNLDYYARGNIEFTNFIKVNNG